MLGKVKGVLVTDDLGDLVNAAVFTAFYNVFCFYQAATNDVFLGGFSEFGKKQLSERDLGDAAKICQR